MGGIPDNYAYFMLRVSEAVRRFKAIEKGASIRIVAHLDSDGITACAILVKLLTDLQRPYSVSIVKQVTRDLIVELADEPHQHYIFADLGSYALSWIEEEMVDKEAVFILDHHEPERLSTPASNIIFVNPYSHGLNGDKEIAGAGVAYMFAREGDRKYTSLAHLAIIGAIGECQERNGFFGMNQFILDDAIAAGTLEVHVGLRCFGFQSKPLHHLLEQSRDPHIPGVTGSEEGALAFLDELRIAAKRPDSEWRTLADLSLVEVKRLIEGIVARRKDEQAPEDVLGCTYLLPKEPADSPLRDAREFSTLLNACGRLGKAMLGVGVCLGDKRLTMDAFESRAAYRKELEGALAWLRVHRHSHCIIEEDGFIIINAEDAIRPNIIGTFVSMLAKGNRFPAGTYVLGMAQEYDGMTKVSLRIAGSVVPEQLDARAVLREIMQPVAGIHGGHREASGGIFTTAKEAYFLETAKDALRQRVAHLA